MSTPARKSGRQSKPTEKFKEYLYGSDECEVPPKKDSISPIIGHTRTSKEKPIKPDTTNHSIITKRGRPRKTIVDEDSFKNKNKKSESEDENIEDYTKGNKFKKEDVPPKKANKTPTTRNTQTLKERTLKPDAASHTINRKRGRPCKSNLDADLLKKKDKELESEESESEDEDNDDKVNNFKKGYEPPRKDNKTSTAGHTQIAKVKPLIPDATSHTIKQKRGRPLKSVVDADSLNNKNDKLERSEDEDTDNDIKGKKVTKENQESGPRRSGRPPKLNERLLNYLHLDEVSKPAPIVQSNSVSIEGHEFKVIQSPNKLKKIDSQTFKVLPSVEKVPSVYDFIASPPKALKNGFDKENKKNVHFEYEPRRSIRTPKTNAKLLNFLSKEVTPKKKTDSIQALENSKKTNESLIMGHVTPRKADKKIFEDITEGELSSPEPRRSSRVPKMNERLLNYLNLQEGTIISLLFADKSKKDQPTTDGSNSSDSSSKPPSGCKSNALILKEESKKSVYDLEPRRSSREPKTSEKLYNYLYSGEGKYKKLPIKTDISQSILLQQSPSVQRTTSEMKISPIGDLSPRRSSRAPKTNDRLRNYLYAGDRKIKKSSEGSGTDSQSSKKIPNLEDKHEKEKKVILNSTSIANRGNISEEYSPNKEPRRSSRTPKTNERLMKYLQPKDLEVASTSKGGPIFTKKQKRLLKESSDSSSSMKSSHINMDSSNKIYVKSNHKNKQISTRESPIEPEKSYKSKKKLEPSSREVLFSDEPLPIPHNAWLLCLGHHSSQFGYSPNTEKDAAKVYIENQGLYLGTHQILLNEYKRQLKEYFCNIPKNLRSNYLELRANHIWNCFNEDIFGDIIESSFNTENNLTIVKKYDIDKDEISINQLSSDSNCNNYIQKTQRRRGKKGKGKSLTRKCKKDIYKKHH